MINNQELYNFALQQLSNAQNYPGEIYGSHPIEAIRDDILMNKYNPDGTLRGKKSDLVNITRGFYDYLEWLQNIPDITPPIGYIRLYRGVRNVPKNKMTHYIPSSWTYDINTASDWTDHRSHCCILQLDYPTNQLLGINSLPGLLEEDETDKLGIMVHNQGEHEVILPAMDLILESPPEELLIDGVPYTIYPVLANPYGIKEAIQNIESSK